MEIEADVLPPVPTANEPDIILLDPTPKRLWSLAFRGGFTICIGLGCIAFLKPFESMPSPLVEIIISGLFGTTFSMGVLAGCWSALGPGPFQYRVPLSLLWILAIPFSWFINSAISPSGPPWQIVVVMGVLACGLWVIPQIVLWCVRIFGRISVALPEANRSIAETQFGIWQLLAFTTVIAAILGGSRIAISFVAEDGSPMETEALVAFGLLILSAMAIVVPLALAMLLPRYCVLSVAIVLGLGTIATLLEVDLLYQMTRSNLMVTRAFFFFLNGFVALWVIMLTGIARAIGFRLVRSA